MKSIYDKLPEKLVSKICFENINEISLRANKNVVLKAENKFYKVDYITEQSEVEGIFKKFCDLSLYAYLDEIKSGFVTIEGGHRIGVCGTVVLKDGELYNIKNINSLNIRVSHEVRGCSDKLDFNIKNLLIISPPGCGKTTILRDLCRRVGKYHKVCIVDERGEIAGVHKGVAYFDVGEMTDVLSLSPKTKGIEYVLRSMSPEYIVTDEIALADYDVIQRSFSYGVNVIATAHGNDVDGTLKRIGIKKTDFDNIVLLSNKKHIGTIEEVIYND